MDHDTFSAIAHRDHLYLNPVSAATMESLYALLRLPPGARVVDLGCGKGEALIRLIELYGVRATGIDRNPWFIGAARTRAAAAVPQAELELIEADVAELDAADAAYDVALCVGSTDLFGGARGALAELHRLITPGGLAVLGEGYWKKPQPDAEYLALLGAQAGDLETHEGNQLLAVTAGMEVLRSWTASDDEWEAYERMYLAGVERHAAEYPDDPEVLDMLARMRRWHDGYQRSGRFNLGFGLYLLRRRPD